jgi:hypothetical protein
MTYSMGFSLAAAGTEEIKGDAQFIHICFPRSSSQTFFPLQFHQGNYLFCLSSLNYRLPVERAGMILMWTLNEAGYDL